MTAANLEMLLDQAKTLSEPDRARLAHDLLATLDGEPDRDAGAVREQEVRRRLTEVKDGTATTISREDLADRLTNRLK